MNRKEANPSSLLVEIIHDDSHPVSMSDNKIIDILQFSWSWLVDHKQITNLSNTVMVIFLTASDIAAINLKFRGQDKSTNVLSFPSLVIPDIAPKSLGEIFICLDVVTTEACTQKLPEAAHLTHLLLHGLLHLLGHDHEDQTEREKMEALEERILAELGWPLSKLLDQ